MVWISLKKIINLAGGRICQGEICQAEAKANGKDVVVPALITAESCNGRDKKPLPAPPKLQWILPSQLRHGEGPPTFWCQHWPCGQAEDLVWCHQEKQCRKQICLLPKLPDRAFPPAYTRTDLLCILHVMCVCAPARMTEGPGLQQHPGLMLLKRQGAGRYVLHDH